MSDLTESLEKFVCILEKTVPPTGLIQQKYLDYLKNNFQSKQISLILSNLGVQKINKSEYIAAENIFNTAIEFDSNDPITHFFLGICLCQYENRLSLVKAKKEFKIAKKILEKTKLSDNQKQQLFLVNKYLDMFKITIYDLFSSDKPSNDTNFNVYNEGQITSVGYNNNIGSKT